MNYAICRKEASESVSSLVDFECVLRLPKNSDTKSEPRPIEKSEGLVLRQVSLAKNADVEITT